ncbi:MAG: molybdopterin-dependent oxidoreductase [Sinimarinibacterium sp.]
MLDGDYTEQKTEADAAGVRANAGTGTTYTFCHICEQICGLAVTTEHGKVTRIDPDRDHGFNWRDYCVKGATAHLALDHPSRIRMPMKRVGDRYVETTYEEAIAEIGERLKGIIERHGPEAVAGYLGNPSSFNFGASVFYSLFMDAVGSHNRFWVGSIDQNAAHVVMEAMYGNPWIALQPDIDRCKCIMLIGTNPAVSGMNWLGRVADGWKRILRAVQDGADLIVVDPRRTESAARATTHIDVQPDTDWAFLLGLIKVIFDNSWCNEERYPQLSGVERIRALVGEVSLDDLATRCDVPRARIEAVAQSFALAPSAMAIARTGPAQGRNGTLAIWLAAVLNLVTNRVESPGGLYYPMGVLDILSVGDRMFPPSKAISRVRQLRAVAGAHALSELPDEINTPGPGQVRALMIVGGNPVMSGPAGQELDVALQKLDLLISIDLFQRESHRNADWLIPALHFLEREDVHPLLHALNPRPFVQMARQVVPPPPGMRPEWEFLRDLALTLDRPLLLGKSWLNSVIKASRMLARVTGNPNHAFSPRWIERALVMAGKKFKWKDIARAKHGVAAADAPIEFGVLFRKLATADGRVDIAPEAFTALLRQRLADLLVDASDPQYPLKLISRRRMHMMNSWLFETSVPRMRAPTGSIVELNADDCRDLGIADGAQVAVESATSSVFALARVSTSVRRGVAVMDHGWGGRTFDPKAGTFQANGGVNRNQLVSNKDLDPLSGVPRLNGTPIRVSVVNARA